MEWRGLKQRTSLSRIPQRCPRFTWIAVQSWRGPAEGPEKALNEELVGEACFSTVVQGCEVAGRGKSVAFGECPFSKLHAPVWVRPARQEERLGKRAGALQMSLITSAENSLGTGDEGRKTVCDVISGTAERRWWHRWRPRGQWRGNFQSIPKIDVDWLCSSNTQLTESTENTTKSSGHSAVKKALEMIKDREMSLGLFRCRESSDA